MEQTRFYYVCFYIRYLFSIFAMVICSFLCEVFVLGKSGQIVNSMENLIRYKHFELWIIWAFPCVSVTSFENKSISNLAPIHEGLHKITINTHGKWHEVKKWRKYIQSLLRGFSVSVLGRGQRAKKTLPMFGGMDTFYVACQNSTFAILKPFKRR